MLLHAGGLRNRPRTGSKLTLGSYDSRGKGEDEDDDDDEMMVMVRNDDDDDDDVDNEITFVVAYPMLDNSQSSLAYMK